MRIYLSKDCFDGQVDFSRSVQGKRRRRHILVLNEIRFQDVTRTPTFTAAHTDFVIYGERAEILFGIMAKDIVENRWGVLIDVSTDDAVEHAYVHTWKIVIDMNMKVVVKVVMLES